MKKPKKFSNYVAALLDGVYEYPELAQDVFRMSYGLEPNEVAECREYLDYVVEHDMVERKTCHIECFYHSALYDSYRCDACGIELTEPITVVGLDWKYCPNCGAKVVE